CRFYHLSKRWVLLVFLSFVLALALHSVFVWVFFLPGSSRFSGLCCPEGKSGVPEISGPSSPLVIVTAASGAYFDRLSNLIGSLHFWEPDKPIVVYDIGLSKEQVKEVACWK